MLYNVKITFFYILEILFLRTLLAYLKYIKMIIKFINKYDQLILF